MPQEDAGYVYLCPNSALRSGERKIFEIDGRSILLLKLGSRLHALRNRCTHLDLPLSDGRIIGEEIICRQHGARYHLANGKPLGGPAVRPLQVYDVRVVDDRIEVRLPEQAEEDGAWPAPWLRRA